MNKVTDPYGLETNHLYDLWQRLTKTKGYLGNETRTTYVKDNNEYVVTTISDDGGSKVSRYDILDRLVLEKEKDVLGQWVEKKYEYDALGRLSRESEPYIGSATQWNEKEYDRYGRLVKLISHTGKVSTISYNGLETTVNDGTKTVITTKDAWGNVIKKEDPGGIINYTYFGNGNLKSANYDGVVINIEQDGWGRKTKLTDPSAGVYAYQYNGFGEITKETTPKGETNYTYENGTGKLTDKIISGEHTGMTIEYTYDGGTKLLNSINLVNSDGNNSDYVYTYDSFKRPKSVVENTPFAQFTKSYTYNSLGQVLTETYAAQSLATSKSSSKKIRNTYQNGGLLKITDFGSGNVLWELEGLNARGQSLSSRLGNSMVKTNSYDAHGYLAQIKLLKETSGPSLQLMKLEFDFDAQRGNLKSRSNSLFNWNETFTYDNQDRLTGFNDNDGSNFHTYDGRGRIQNNSQLGLYGYSGTSYRQTSLNLNLAGETYYNTLDHQNITYNAFSAPVEIIEHGKDKVSFQYNAFEGRANMFYGGLQTDKTQRRYSKHYSHDGSMEFTVDKQTNNTTFVTYIGGDAYSAPVIWHSKKGSTTSNHYYYLHRDYLGSILAITDGNGNFKEKRHFDAWGNIVKLEDGNGNALSSFKILDRGYTGHEHLLGVGIIHMNGRLYDPMLHRFLSPDNFVQNPFNTQNFNRYGYVLNNPLKYTDPSGEEILTIIGGIISLGILIANAIWGEHDATPYQDTNPPNNNVQTPQDNGGSNNIASSIADKPVEDSFFEIPHGIRSPSWLSSMRRSRIAHSISPNDWIRNRYGAYLWDDSAIDQASTRAGWEYVGKELPTGVHRYDILTEIDGRLYHKNTSNIFASIANYFGGNFVEHKPYQPTTENAINEILVTGGGYAAGSIALKGLSHIKWLRGKGGKINGFTISKGSAYGAKPRFDFHQLLNSYKSRANSRMTIPTWLNGKKLPHWHRGKGNNLRYHRPWEIGPDGKRRW